jgi:hypothetical protein
VRLSAELVPLTVPEIRRLLAALGLAVALVPGEAERVLAWSSWRRRHQAVARRCHYTRHLALYAT